MKQHEEEMNTRIWDYIDGSCSPEEAEEIAALIAGNNVWNQHYNNILELHQSLTVTEPDMPSMRFTKNVMEEITKTEVAPAAKIYINKWIIGSIACFFLVCLTVLLIAGVGSIDWQWHSTTASPIFTSMTARTEKIASNITHSSWSYIALGEVLLGLVLLDAFRGRWKHSGKGSGN